MKVTILPPELGGQPDITAMLQAFYSRSNQSITERLGELEGAFEEDQDFQYANEGVHDSRVKQIREALSKFYVGYGHNSIGDCGSITLFIEGVTFLAAKAIQDNPLYNGQESSTRYIDFTTQPEPEYLTAEQLEDHRYWMDKYCETMPQIRAALGQQYPDMSERAIAPRAFDIGRGLLPMTGLTQLSWHGTIRTIRDHIARLLAHPYPHVQSTAICILQALSAQWPDLFGPTMDSDDSYEWFLGAGERVRVEDEAWNHLSNGVQVYSENARWMGELSREYHLQRLGTVEVLNRIDYGGYRDVQRHRRGYVKSSDPLASCLWMRWYADRLEDLDVQFDLQGRSSTTFQVPPLMALVDTSFTADLSQWQYVTALRTGPAVHASVRNYFADMARAINGAYPAVRAAQLLQVNHEETDWERRARQTIERRTV